MKQKSKILDILDDGGKTVNIILETSHFHPSGGGQPGDSGWIASETFTGMIIDTIQDNAGILHVTRIKKGKPETGQIVEIEMDEKRHDLLTQMHTAEHLISRILQNEHEGIYTTKVNVHEDESTIYFKYDNEFTWTMLFEAEDRVNEIIQENRKVTTSLVSVDEARSMNGLKVKWERIPCVEEIRVVRIEDLDITACSGSHVNSTGEIPGVIVSNFKGSSPDWEVKFTLSREKLLNKHSRIIRKFSRNTGCPVEKLEKTYIKLQEENRTQRKMIDKLTQYIELPWERSEIGKSCLYSIVLPGFSRDTVFSAAKKQVGSGPKAIVLILMPCEISHVFSFLLLQGEEKNIDLKKVVKAPELKVKGGGDGQVVSGVTVCNSINTWKRVLEQYYL